MKLKVYADRMSQPSRAVLIFCKVNGIDFEQIKVALFWIFHQRLTPSRNSLLLLMEGSSYLRVRQFLSILLLPFQELQTIADLTRRAKIHSVLDWHHLNLRHGPICSKYCTSSSIGSFLNQQAAAEAEKILISSLSKIENIWLKGNGRFLLGGFQPSIADLSLVCEIMQLELLDEKDRDRILGPHKKIQQWIESTRNATRPHFDEVHNVLYKVKMKLSVQQSSQAVGVMESRIKTPLTSKM